MNQHRQVWAQRYVGIAMSLPDSGIAFSAGLTGLLAAADVPLLARLSLAHRSDDFVPGVRL